MSVIGPAYGDYASPHSDRKYKSGQPPSDNPGYDLKVYKLDKLIENGKYNQKLEIARKFVGETKNLAKDFLKYLREKDGPLNHIFTQSIKTEWVQAAFIEDFFSLKIAIEMTEAKIEKEVEEFEETEEKLDTPEYLSTADDIATEEIYLYDTLLRHAVLIFNHLGVISEAIYDWTFHDNGTSVNLGIKELRLRAERQQDNPPNGYGDQLAFVDQYVAHIRKLHSTLRIHSRMFEQSFESITGNSPVLPGFANYHTLAIRDRITHLTNMLRNGYDQHIARGGKEEDWRGLNQL